MTEIRKDQMEVIQRSFDPLAIVMIFLYKFAHDALGVPELSSDTLLWFAASAAAIRLFLSQILRGWGDARRNAMQLEILRAQERIAMLNAETASAAAKAAEAAAKAAGACSDFASTGTTASASDSAIFPCE